MQYGSENYYFIIEKEYFETCQKHGVISYNWVDPSGGPVGNMRKNFLVFVASLLVFWGTVTYLVVRMIL